MEATSTPRRRAIALVLVALVAVSVIAGVFIAIRERVPHTVPALFLLLPIIWVSTRLNRVAAIAVAVVSAAVYALAFLPPIGGVRIGLTEDVVILVAFVVVAFAMSILTDRRNLRRAALLDDGQAMLLRSVSHDLRNPLSTIRTVSTDLLDRDPGDDQGRSDLLNLLVDETERMDRIVGNLLNVTRIQAGALLPEMQPLDLGVVLSAGADRMEQVHGRRVHRSIDARLPTVNGDPTQLDQVVANLLDNALYHAHGRVDLVARTSKDRMQVVIEIIDDGPGLSLPARRRLFEPFNAGDDPGSTGLGLTVCRAIVEAHGGTITVRDADGGGTVVRFSIPRAIVQGARGGGSTTAASGAAGGAAEPRLHRP